MLLFANSQLSKLVQPGSKSLVFFSAYFWSMTADSCQHVCIEDCYIAGGDDGISIKSGWDEYGVSFGRPSSHIQIRRIITDSHSSSGISFGSEMSGGISDVKVCVTLMWDTEWLSGGQMNVTYRSLHYWIIDVWFESLGENVTSTGSAWINWGKCDMKACVLN